MKTAVTPRARWGDREARRRDILDAARRQMVQGGYLALNMRDIAAGAGVSPGTLYAYFSTKEEIFATLYAEAIEAHNARIAPVCEAARDLETLLVEVMTAYLDLYGAYGRYFTLWSWVQADDAHRDSPLPNELKAALRRATVDQGELIRQAVVRLAQAEGRVLGDETLVLPFLWTVFNGVADHFTSQRRHLNPHSAHELIAYAARTVTAGLRHRN